MYDLLIRNGASSSGDITDVGFLDGAIAELGAGLAGDAHETIDAGGCTIMPGLVDPHVHLSGRFGSAVGFGMLVRAGVTTALDLAGDADDLRRSLPRKGCGLTVGVLHPLIPRETVSGPSPDEHEVEQILDRQLGLGALGLKVLGGHYPLTPEATRTVIQVCARRGAYCAIHAGTTETGSDVTGVEELVTLAEGLPVHVAHVNSYCRGQIEDPSAEAARAIAALSSAPAAWSESYLSLLNGADAECRQGVPASGVVRTCLRLGGFEETQAGLEAAIAAGWGRIQVELTDDVGFLTAPDGLERFRNEDTAVAISFPVNPPASALALALALTREQAFAIDAFGSDGGAIPRNSTLVQAMSLVRGGFLSLEALVEKACRAPALRLGLPQKGKLEPGADGDVIVVRPDGSCRATVIGGRAVVLEGVIVVSDAGTLLEPAAA